MTLDPEKRYEAKDAQQAALLELALRESDINFQIVEHSTATNLKEVHFYVQKKDEIFMKKAVVDLSQKIADQNSEQLDKYKFLIGKYKRYPFTSSVF